MKLLAKAGAIICPSSPSYYSKPASIDELAMKLAERVLRLAGFDVENLHWDHHNDTETILRFKRW